MRKLFCTRNIKKKLLLWKLCNISTNCMLLPSPLLFVSHRILAVKQNKPMGMAAWREIMFRLLLLLFALSWICTSLCRQNTYVAYRLCIYFILFTAAPHSRIMFNSFSYESIHLLEYMCCWYTQILCLYLVFICTAYMYISFEISAEPSNCCFHFSNQWSCTFPRTIYIICNEHVRDKIITSTLSQFNVNRFLFLLFLFLVV